MNASVLALRRVLDAPGTAVVFLPMMPGDAHETAIHEQLVERVDPKRCAVVTGLELLPSETKAVLASVDVAIGYPYHFHLFALSAGVPSVMLCETPYYRQKLGGLAFMYATMSKIINVGGDKWLREFENALHAALQSRDAKPASHLSGVDQSRLDSPVSAVLTFVTQGRTAGPAKPPITRLAGPRESTPKTCAPLFSVVIPTRCRADSLRRTIQSILALEGARFEVIIVDQSPDEETCAAVNSFGRTELRYLRIKERGRGLAITLGAALARGQYLAITDDDILVERNWLASALGAFERHKPCDAVVGRISVYPREHGADYVTPQHAEFPTAMPLCASRLQKGYGANQVFDRRSWNAVGGMDPRLGTGGICYGSDDWDILYRMLMHGMQVFYDPSVRVWHDGWQTRKQVAAKAALYNRAQIAAHIKCWLEVGGPALRDITAETGRLLALTTNLLLRRRWGTSRYYVRRLGEHLAGIPLGIELALGRAKEKHE